jgi:hypothetical protein
MEIAMTPSDIESLLEAWRTAERALDGTGSDAPRNAGLSDAVRLARDAYLEAVRERARIHGHTTRTRDLHDDIAQLQEAEERRTSSEPSTPPYHEAAREIQDRAFDIATQVAEDEVRAEEEKRRREAGKAD